MNHKPKATSKFCCGKFLAEGVGFEPTSPFGETVFKTAAIDHSAIPPLENHFHHREHGEHRELRIE